MTATRRMTDWQRSPYRRLLDEVRYWVKRDPDLTESVILLVGLVGALVVAVTR